MAEHLQEWLSTYLDGELNGWRRERVEQHLATCPACRTELETLRCLSQELQKVPLPPEFPSTERFTSQVLLRLPRQQVQPSQSHGRELGWWLAPAILLVAWAFVQAVFWLNSSIWAAGQVGLLGEAADWLVPERQSTGAVTGIFNWLGVMPGETTAQIAAFSESIGWNLLLQLLVEGGLALLYVGWLVTWWQRRQQQPARLMQSISQESDL